MSSNKRRELRTQGRFPNICEDKQKERNGGSKQTKLKSDSVEASGRRMTPGCREIDKTTSDSADDTMKVTYQENCQYTFSHLDPPKQPEEIKERGMKVLSKSNFGESRILYYPSFIELKSAFEDFDKLEKGIPWRQMNIVIRGREFPQPRLVAWYGPFPYAYSGVVLEPQEMPDDVLHIKKTIENSLALEGIYVEFNSVLLNKYRDGSDSVAWHSDDELSMGIDPTIASISLGEVRRFEIRRKPTRAESDPPIEYFLRLKNGSLLIMDGAMQMEWQHRVPKESINKAPRINLTFRTVHEDKRFLRATK